MVRRAVLWSFVGQFASFALSFGGSIIVARLLSPHEFGVYSVAAATLGVLQLVASFGVNTYAIREPDLSAETFDTAFTINTIFAIVLAVLVIAASVPVSIFLREPAVAPLLQVLALSPVIGIPAFKSGVMLQREMKFGAISAVGVLTTAAATITTSVSAALGASYMSFAYGTLTSALLATIATMMAEPGYGRVKTSLVNWRPIVRFGLKIMSVNGIAAAAARLSDILIGRLLGLSALGLMSRASSLSNIIMTYVYGGAMRVVYAKLAKDYRETGAVRDAFIPGLRMIIAVVGPMMIGLAILARPIVQVLYGEKWLDAAPILSLFMLAQFLSLTFAMNWELYVVRDKLTLQVKLEGARSLFGLASKVVGCAFGLIGAAASSIVDAVFSMCLYVPTMAKLADSSGRELARIYGEALLLTAAACAPLLALMVLRDWSAATSVGEMVASVVVGSLTWLCVVLKTEHPLADEIRRMVSAVRLMRAGQDVRSQ